MKTSKFQHPSSREISNPNHQTAIVARPAATARPWSLKFGASLVLGAWCLVLLLAPAAFSQSYSIDWFTIDGGGGTSTGSLYSVSGTIGQPDASGALAGGSYSLLGGFWSLLSVVQAVGAPTLTITLTPTNTAIVSWAYPSTGFNLQQNTDLGTANWVAASQTVTNNGAINYIIVNPPTGNRFYRLFKP